VDRDVWQPWYRREGVTVFLGTSEANADAVLVSCVARAPPKLLAYVRGPPWGRRAGDGGAGGMLRRATLACLLARLGGLACFCAACWRVCVTWLQQLGRLARKQGGRAAPAGCSAEARPRAQLLMAGGEHGGGRHAPRLLQCLDSHTAVFHARWRASGWVAALLAPRDAVLRRSWRCGPGLAARQAGAGRLVQAPWSGCRRARLRAAAGLKSLY